MAESPVKAEITAAVWKIEAGPGARVAEGEPILLLESMKMEIPVAAPRDGRVKAVLVAEGDLVEEGQVVATLEH